ncbi:MAG: hypothetical protein WBQ18_03970 [Solirubrobacteraceae bacterium]
MAIALALGAGLSAGPAAAATTTTASRSTFGSAAATTTTTTTTTAAPGTPVLVSSKTTPPAGYRLTATRVLAIARRDPRVRAELQRHPRAEPFEYTKGAPTWQVSWFSDTKPQRELLQVYVDDNTAAVTQAWTGFQVAWTMARGYPGAFGRRVNNWYIWLPLCLLFAAPFVPWRRRPSLLSLDVLVLLSFSVSLAFFNHAKIGLSVPLVYPPLIYLMVRMLLIANGRGVPRAPAKALFSDSWLAVGTVFLMAFRIGLNLLNSNVIDVGYAGVIGATKLIHGAPLYGNWPHDNLYGDTYGPISYLAYVPFRLIFGWGGTWDSLPAAHAAAICFDLLTLGALYVLGRRLRGNSLGLLLAYCWAAFPFTLYAMNSNTNDSLVGATIVVSLLVIRSAPARGVMALVAGATKFAPLALAPLLWRGTEDRPRGRSLVAFVVAFAFAAVVVMLPVLLNADLGYFWRDSIEYQSNRVTPFSVWGLWGGLGVVQHLLQGAVIALALGAGLLPARRGPVQVAALAAAILIALQVTLNYWLYPYIVWFFPVVLVALLAGRDAPAAGSPPAWADAPEAEPAPIRMHIASP